MSAVQAHPAGAPAIGGAPKGGLGRMSKRKKILYGIALVSARPDPLGSDLRHQRPQTRNLQRHRLLPSATWFSVGGIAFNKGVMYLLIATALTIGVMLTVARNMKARPKAACRSQSNGSTTSR